MKTQNKTNRQILKELKESQKADYDKLKMELRLNSCFTGCDSSIVYNLEKKDTAVTYTFKDGEDLEKVIKIIDKHKPVEVVYFQNGCAGFRAKEKCTENNQTDIFPIWFNIEDSHWFIDGYNHGITLKYYTEMKGNIVAVNIKLGGFRKMASISADYVSFNGGFRYDNVRLNKHETLNNFKSTTWGRGSNEAKNNFTLHETKEFTMDEFYSKLRLISKG